ncbi:hypothetical protein KRMM14A1259_45180 [Krasilnikovia sp. MM14-A1259]
MSGRTRRRARHAWTYPPEERGRRILWRTTTAAAYLALTAAVVWFARLRGWSDGWVPKRGLIGIVALPYWAVVTAVWKRYGPYMPQLHGDGRPGRLPPEPSSGDGQSDAEGQG